MAAPTLCRIARLSSCSPSVLPIKTSSLPLATTTPLQYQQKHPLLRSLSTSPFLGRKWDKGMPKEHKKRTHYDIDKYPVHVRKRIAAERAKDRELYNPYKIEPLREDENEDFVKSHFDSRESAYREDEYSYDDTPLHQEVTFADLGLNFKLLNLLKDDGLYYPTPIQSAVIPNALENRDVIGISLTGSGKTLAYVLPIIQKRIQSLRTYQKLQKNLSIGKPAPIHFLILAPTRELALQIRSSFLKLKIKAGLAVGGSAAKNQIPEIRTTPILIATPGRLLEFVETGVVDLGGVKVFVLDEADKMLNMGFFSEVEKVCEELGGSKQTMMLSATLPREVLNLARTILHNPLELDIRGDQATVPTVTQYSIYTKGIYDKNDKLKELLEYIHKHEENPRVLLFCNAKREVNSVTKHLVLNTDFTCHPLHGDLSFAARRRGLRLFQEGEVQLLVATDVVARGIDFQKVTHVINYNLPTEPETYVHRVGRTARGGESGMAINLRSQFGQDAVYMEKIQESINVNPKVIREELIYTIFQEEL